MRLDWLKDSMPRSLYGRAFLILVLPVVALQLVVSIVFIQRHFEDVTAQLTENTLSEVEFVLDRMNEAPDAATARRLGLDLAPAFGLAVDMPVGLQGGDRRRFYDLPGRVVINLLRRRLEGVVGIDLQSHAREVRVYVQTPNGGMKLTIPRARVSASNPHQLLAWMVFTGVLMTLVSYIFLRNQLRPIKRLAEAANAFGMGRHVKYRPAGAREVRLAGQSFLDMRARIERQIEQRTLMLSGVSHDLRTPLTRLQLALSMMPEDEETRAMESDVREMSRLVDEFLAFARGDALDDATPTDAKALLEKVSSDARRGGAEVTEGQLEDVGLVEMRPLAIIRALENLIGNAVRYGTKARVSLLSDARSVTFVIEDDGPGIAAEHVEEAVKPFVRLDPARNQNRSTGVGLGLSIAMDIARRHGGALVLGRSETLGGLKAELRIAR